jgi:hypothetical protein
MPKYTVHGIEYGAWIYKLTLDPGSNIRFSYSRIVKGTMPVAFAGGTLGEVDPGIFNVRIDAAKEHQREVCTPVAWVHSHNLDVVLANGQRHDGADFSSKDERWARSTSMRIWLIDYNGNKRSFPP